MTRRLRTPALALPALIAAALPAASADRDADALRWIPRQALMVAVVRGPDRRIEDLRRWWQHQPRVAERLETQFRQNPELLAARIMFTGFAAGLDLDPWQLVAGMLGRQIAIGMAPGEHDQPHVVLVSLTRDRALRDRVLDQFHLVTGLVRDGRPDPERSRTIDGVRVYSLDGNLYHCVLDDALVITNTPAAMRAVLALRSDPAGSMARSQPLREARGRVPADAIAWAWGDVAALRDALTAGDGLPGRIEDLGAAVLFGPLYHAARTGRSLIAFARWEPPALRLEARVTGVRPPDGPYRAFVPPASTVTSWNPDELAGYLGSIELRRNWMRLFADRELLLAPQAASDLADAAVTFTTFFGGLDFVEHVLPRLAGPVQIVAVRRSFDPDEVVPVPKLPAFALLAPLRQADAKFVQRLYSAASSALTIISVDMAQQGEPSWLLDVDRYRGTRILLTRYAEPMDDDASTRPARREGDARYNFTPAVAVAGNRFILASSRGVLEQILDALRAAEDRAASQARSARRTLERLELRVAPLVALLRDNRRELIANRMLEEDLPRDKAAGQIDTFLELLGLIRGGSLQTGYGDEQWWAKAELQMTNDK